MTEIEKNNMISAEYSRIISYYEDLSEGQIAVIYPLVQNAAVMRTILEELREIIISTGVIEEYVNGEHQRGLKQSAAVQAFNSTIKNYASVIKQLFGLLPPEKRPAPSVSAFTPHVKTHEEWEAEMRETDERQAQLNAEFAAAVEKQKRDREKWAKLHTEVVK